MLTVFGCDVLFVGGVAMYTTPGKWWKGLFLFPWEFWRTVRSGWKPSLVVTGLALFSGWLLALILSNYSFFYTFSLPKQTIHRTLTVDAGNMEVSEAVREWFKREDYRAGDRWGLNSCRVPDGKKLTVLHYHEAWRPSPYDRWRMTWRGPERVAPHLVVTCLASLEPAETQVEIRTPWASEEIVRSWSPIVDSLEAAIEQVSAESSENALDTTTHDNTVDESVSKEKK